MRIHEKARNPVPEMRAEAQHLRNDQSCSLERSIGLVHRRLINYPETISTGNCGKPGLNGLSLSLSLCSTAEKFPDRLIDSTAGLLQVFGRHNGV